MVEHYTRVFQQHVENVVWGNCPKRILSGKVKENVGENIEKGNTRRRSAFHDRFQKKSMKLMVAVMVVKKRRKYWQMWRLELILIEENM